MSNKRGRLVVCLFAGVALLALSVVAFNTPRAAAKPPGGGGGGTPTVAYSMTIIGTLPGHNAATVYGINDHGDVVGYSEASDGWHAGFVWYHNGSGGALHDLNDLIDPEDPMSDWQIVSATDINNAGQICGVAELPGYGQATFRFDPADEGGFGTLTLVGPGTGYPTATLNEGGDVAGAVPGTGQSFIYSDDLPVSSSGYRSVTIGGFIASKISNRSANDPLSVYIGGIVGIGPSRRAGRYRYGQVANLGTLKNGYSEAFAVNDAGQCAGMAYIKAAFGGGDVVHAFSYADPGPMRDLGVNNSASSIGLDINNGGDIVGPVFGVNISTYAFLHIPGSGSYDLRKLVVGLNPADTALRAIRINNALDIAGHYGLNAAFLRRLP